MEMEEMIKEFIEANKEVFERIRLSPIKMDEINVEPDMEYISEFFDEVARESKQEFIEFLNGIEEDDDDVRYIIKALDDRGNEVETVKNNLTKEKLVKYLNIIINPKLIIHAGKRGDEFIIVADIRNIISISRK